ncbi:MULTISPECIES: metal-dependent hydrolase [unclassified Campylobacter]|uniref:aminofutalosine deaminase family hydrolase n=1 Tax=unclassified Campylobacter TaxID=2593542 RepID=UPI001472C94C|nr:MULTISPECIES: metal-dependent hydrolase [unclassified Campylobacter]QKG28663.1 metallo-dependent hydrolase, subgroup D [Campylobacter sp. RM16187]
MTILKPKFIMLCDENFTILQDKAVAFDDKIIKIGEASELKKEFKNAEFIEEKEAILAPAFINPHVHLEFSANKTSLVYGDFLEWLSSVINSRSTLSQQANEEVIKSAIKTMQKSGVGTIGAVSSFGTDLKACVNSSARVIYFNEILGSNEEFLDVNWQGFKKRFDESVKFKSEFFTPAISVHSPYSTHPNLAKAAINLAKEQNLLVSTHLMESDHEREWLKSGVGGFKEWLGKFSKFPKPLYSVDSFIELFKDVRTLFTHCVYMSDFSKFDNSIHSVTHCAFSNRLLSKKTLNLQNLLDQNISFNIGTDGLSSNISLNFLDELRANLLIHSDFDLKNLAKILLLASTSWCAKSLNLNLGEIKEGKLADMALYDRFGNTEQDGLALMFLLHAKECKKLYIQGKPLNLD